LADHRAVAAVCESVVDLPRDSFRRELFGHDLEFHVYSVADFERPMAAGVSLFLYRVDVNGNHRFPPTRATDRVRQTLLPLDLHFLLTAWSREPSLQHTIVGWMMRVLESTPTLRSGRLNGTWADVFHADEGVEIVFSPLSNEDPLEPAAELEPVGTRRLLFDTGGAR
jgi:hypothetical protein